MENILAFIVTNLPMIICLLVGVTLVTVEIFLPGFGLPGITGLALLVIAIGLAWIVPTLGIVGKSIFQGGGRKSSAIAAGIFFTVAVFAWGHLVYSIFIAKLQNLIWNNTITAYTGQFTTYGVNVANTSSGAIWEIMEVMVAFLRRVMAVTSTEWLYSSTLMLP